MSSNNKSQLLKISLMQFYTNPDNLNKFLNVIEKNTDYSLRVIEWFCNNYSKKNNVIYKVNNTEFNVYLSYKSHLHSYQKKQFDPCKRQHKGFETFPFEFTKGMHVITTVGQLNFFRWCIVNKILEYIHKHLKDIKDDMIKYNSTLSKQRSSSPIKKKLKDCIKLKNDFKQTLTPVSSTNLSTTATPKTSIYRKKRQPISIPATRTCIKRYTKAILEF